MLLSIMIAFNLSLGNREVNIDFPCSMSTSGSHVLHVCVYVICPFRETMLASISMRSLFKMLPFL